MESPCSIEFLAADRYQKRLQFDITGACGNRRISLDKEAPEPQWPTHKILANRKNSLRTLQLLCDA
jgi:hypothetical protein